MGNIDTTVELLRARAAILQMQLRARDPRNSRIETIEVVVIAAAIVGLALLLVALLTGFFDRHKGPLEG